MECKKKVGFDWREFEIILECVKEYLLDDWKLLECLLVDEFKVSLWGVLFCEDRVHFGGCELWFDEVSCCFVGYVVQIANDCKCVLVNKVVTVVEDLINMFDSCLGEDM